MTQPRDFGALYAEVMQFYADQMHALDEGKFEEYAETFTVDGEFRHTPGRPAARGRTGIVDELREFHTRFDDDPVQRRHWFAMVSVRPADDGTVNTSYYALVVTTRPQARPVLAPSCTVNDVLVREDGRLRNRSRIVDHDVVR